MMSDFRQSDGYREVLRKRGCLVEELAHGQTGLVGHISIVPLIRTLIIQGVDDVAVLPAAERVARRRKLVSIHIAPHVELSTPEAGVWSAALSAHGFRWSRSSISPTKTLIVPLHTPEEEIIGQMKPKTRYNVRLAGRRGLRVEVTSASQLAPAARQTAEFHKVFSENCRRLKMKAPSLTELSDILSTFGNSAFVVIAYLSSGEPGAAASFVVSEETASYQMNGSTDAGRHNFATDLAVWEGMRESKRRGCRWFDFDGIADDRYKEDEEWKGFTRFKTGFGGREVTYLGSFVKRLPFLRPVVE